MKFLLEFKKYAPVLFTFLFLAAVFASCFFDTRKQDKAEKESQRYDQSLVWIAIIQGDYYRRTNCSISNPPGQIKIPASNPDGFKCISSSRSTSGYFFIAYFETGQVIPLNISTVNVGTKLICKCKDSVPPLTEENTWYKKSPVSSDWADFSFTHTYQKDSSGSITGVDPFTPTNSCLPKCGKYPEIYEKITIQ